MTDEKLMMFAKIVIFCHLGINIHEMTMVKNVALKEKFLYWFLKIFTGNLPFMTKGPFAIFFGGPELEQLLSSDEKPGKHIPMLYLISSILNLTIFISKKIYAKKIQRNQILRNIIVGNLTNVLTISVIIILLSMLTIAMVFHFM